MWNQFGLNENLFDFQKICDSEGILISISVPLKWDELNN